MKITELFELKRVAKKAGGDRYETPDGSFVIYVPQHISRPDGGVLEKLKITFED